MKFHKLGVAAFAALAAASAAAQAPDADSDIDPEARTIDRDEEEEYALSLGIGAAGIPGFRGADSFKWNVFPYIDGHYKNIAIIDGARREAALNIVRVDAHDLGVFEAGAAVRYMSSRKDSDDEDVLKGLEEISPTAYGGLRLKWARKGLSISGRMLYDIGNETGGIMGEIASGYSFSPFQDWRFNFGGRLEMGDESHNDGYFGISENDALQSQRFGVGIKESNIKAGLTAVGLSASANYQVMERGYITGFLGYERLLPTVADSSLVSDFGSANQFVGGLSFVYKVF